MIVPKGGKRRHRGFTLVELMVTISLIVILVGVLATSAGPLFSSNKQAQVINTFDTLLARAQTLPSVNGIRGLRVERAFKVDEDGKMLKIDEEPVYLNHQRVTLVKVASASFGEYFEPLDDVPVIALPPSVWVAPGYVLSTDKSGDPIFIDEHLKQSYDKWPSSGSAPPQVAGYAEPEAYAPIDTFFILFGQDGRLISYSGQRPFFLDKRQIDTSVPQAYAMVPGADDEGSPEPYPAARSLILYDRDAYEGLVTAQARRDFLGESRAVLINPHNGSIVHAGD